MTQTVTTDNWTFDGFPLENSVCDCCGEPNLVARGVVLDDKGEPVALYVAPLEPNKEPRAVRLGLQFMQMNQKEQQFYEHYVHLQLEQGVVTSSIILEDGTASESEMVDLQRFTGPFAAQIRSLTAFILQHDAYIQPFLEGKPIIDSFLEGKPIIDSLAGANELNQAPGSRTEFGIPRTSCDCKLCRFGCKVLPARLIPADLTRMIFPGEDPLTWARQHLRANPALVLAPARTVPGGPCHWLTPDGHCAVHAVSPFGCAMYSCFVSGAVGDYLSMCGNRAILQDQAEKGLYSRIAETLWNEGLRDCDTLKGKRALDAYATKFRTQEERKRARDQKKKSRVRKKKSSR